MIQVVCHFFWQCQEFPEAGKKYLGAPKELSSVLHFIVTHVSYPMGQKKKSCKHTKLQGKEIYSLWEVRGKSFICWQIFNLLQLALSEDELIKITNKFKQILLGCLIVKPELEPEILVKCCPVICLPSPIAMRIHLYRAVWSGLR